MIDDVKINGNLIIRLYEREEGVAYFLYDSKENVIYSDIINWEELLDSPIQDYRSAARRCALEREGIEVLQAYFIRTKL